VAVEYLVMGVNSNYSLNSATINGRLNKRLYESILYPFPLPTVLDLGWEVQQPIRSLKFLYGSHANHFILSSRRDVMSFSFPSSQCSVMMSHFSV